MAHSEHPRGTGRRFYPLVLRVRLRAVSASKDQGASLLSQLSIIQCTRECRSFCFRRLHALPACALQHDDQILRLTSIARSGAGAGRPMVVRLTVIPLGMHRNPFTRKYVPTSSHLGYVCLVGHISTIWAHRAAGRRLRCARRAGTIENGTGISTYTELYTRSDGFNLEC